MVQGDDEEDHRAHAEQRGDRDAEPRHEPGVAEGADRAQHQDRVGERADVVPMVIWVTRSPKNLRRIRGLN